MNANNKMKETYVGKTFDATYYYYNTIFDYSPEKRYNLKFLKCIPGSLILKMGKSGQKIYSFRPNARMRIFFPDFFAANKSFESSILDKIFGGIILLHTYNESFMLIFYTTRMCFFGLYNYLTSDQMHTLHLQFLILHLFPSL